MIACLVATDHPLLRPSTLSSGIQAILLIAEGVVSYGLAFLVVSGREIAALWRQMRAG